MTVGSRIALLLLLSLCVLLPGTAVRLLGIRHGEPRWIFHPDVSKQIHVAMRVAWGKEKPVSYDREDVERRMYPYGTAVVLGTLARLGERSGMFHIDRGDYPENRRWMWSVRLRLFASAVYLLATLLFVLSLAGHLPARALIPTALLLALEPLCAVYSHYGMNDVPLMGLLLLVWACTRPMEDDGSRAPAASLAAGFLLGAGFGFKYQALLGFVFPLAAWAALLAARRPLRAALSAGIFLPAFAVGLLFTSPVLREDPLGFPGHFLEFMRWQTNILGDLNPEGGNIARNVFWLGRFALPSGLVFLVPGALWAGAGAFRGTLPRRSRAFILAGLLFPLLLTGLLVLSRELMRENDVMYVFPFLIVLTGFTVADLGARWKPRGILASVPVAGTAALVLLFGLQAARDSLAFARPDTRLIARAWCRDHIAPGSVVLRDRYALPVGLDGVEESVFRNLLVPPASNLIAEGRYDYLLATSLSHDRFFDPLQPYHSLETQEVHRDLIEPLPVLALFEGRRLPFNNPTVTVYGRLTSPSPGREPPQGPPAGR